MSEPIKRFESNTHYLIIDYNQITTKFGNTFVLTDDKFDKYFSTKKVDTFLKQTNLKKNGGEILFKVVTGPRKSFKDKEDREISYVEHRIVRV